MFEFAVYCFLFTEGAIGRVKQSLPIQVICHIRFSLESSSSPNFLVISEAVFCEDVVCRTKPDRAQVYRSWNVPDHEFGHAIENTLGLQNRSDEVYRKIAKNWGSVPRREHFARGTSTWFGQKGNRESMPTIEYDYVSKTFDAQNDWTQCAPVEMRTCRSNSRRASLSFSPNQ